MSTELNRYRKGGAGGNYSVPNSPNFRESLRELFKIEEIIYGLILNLASLEAEGNLSKRNHIIAKLDCNLRDEQKILTDLLREFPNEEDRTLIASAIEEAAHSKYHAPDEKTKAIYTRIENLLNWLLQHQTPDFTNETWYEEINCQEPNKVGSFRKKAMINLAVGIDVSLAALNRNYLEIADKVTNPTSGISSKEVQQELTNYYISCYKKPGAESAIKNPFESSHDIICWSIAQKLNMPDDDTEQIVDAQCTSYLKECVGMINASGVEYYIYALCELMSINALKDLQTEIPVGTPGREELLAYVQSYIVSKGLNIKKQVPQPTDA